jgi:hypothetical protein
MAVRSGLGHGVHAQVAAGGGHSKGLLAEPEYFCFY